MVDTVSYLKLVWDLKYESFDTLDICMYESTTVVTYGSESEVTVTVTENGVTVTSSSTAVVVTEGTEAGDYILWIKSSDGCDSIVELHIDYAPVKRDTIFSDILYEGTDYSTTIANHTFDVTEGGMYTYTDTLTAANGCDSIVTITLRVETVFADTVCQSQVNTYADPYNVVAAGLFTQAQLDSLVRMSGQLVSENVILQDSEGRDSTVKFTLTVLPAYSGETFYGDTVYVDHPFDMTLGGFSFHVTEPGTMTQLNTLQTVNGCDSVVTVVLIVEPVHYDTVCTLDPAGYKWQNIYDLPADTNSLGLYEFPGTKTIGNQVVDTVSYLKLVWDWKYESFDTLNICMYESTTVVTYGSELEVTVTESGLIMISSSTAVVTEGVEAGDFTLWMKSSDGCDSVVELHIDYAPVKRDTLSAVTVDITEVSNNTITVDGTTFTDITAPGTYYHRDTLTAANGCDSIVVKVLEVSGTVNIPVVKIWDDAHNQDGYRPESVRVGLFADGEFLMEHTLTGNGDTLAYQFVNLQKYNNESGLPVQYEVKEFSIKLEEWVTSGEYDNHYFVNIVGDTLRNTHVPDSFEIKVVKTWFDNKNNDGYRPDSLCVYLVKIDTLGFDTLSTIVLRPEPLDSDTNRWYGSFGRWPEKSNGNFINYDVTESSIEGYLQYPCPSIYREDTVIFNLQNNHDDETVSVAAHKIWNINGDEAEDKFYYHTMGLFRSTTSTTFDPLQVPDEGNDDWELVDRNELGFNLSYYLEHTTYFASKKLYSNGTKISYAVKELNIEPDYLPEYPNGNLALAENNYRVTVTNTYVKPVDHGVALRKKLAGRPWLDTDTFAFALIPHEETNPMPANTDTVNGIVFSPLLITNSSTQVSDSVYEGVFDNITFHLEDLGGQEEKTFTYHIRELTATESGIGRVPGVTYGTERYEVNITVKREYLFDGQTEYRYLVKSVSCSLVTHDNATPLGENEVPMITNRYNDSVTVYRMVADKQLSTYGSYETLEDGMYSFSLRPVGVHSNRAPMPANTQTVNGQRVLTVTNEEHTVRFFDDDDPEDGLRFDYNELIDVGFTAEELDAGLVFEYEMFENIPADAVNNGDGTWSRFEQVNGMEEESVYDALVHVRKVTVHAIHENGHLLLEVTGGHNETGHHDYYIGFNGDTVFVTPDHTHYNDHHGISGVPIFRNAHIATTRLTVQKIWNDVGNALNTRPNQVTVTLWADGIATDSVATLSTSNQWRHTFLRLPAYTHDGEAVNYTIVENAIPDYEPTYQNGGVNWIVINKLTRFGEDTDCTVSVDYTQLSDCPDIDCSPVSDSDGNTYQTVKIDGYCWMAENLRKQTPSAMMYMSAVSPDAETNFATYGYLYTWHDAAGGTDTPARVNGYVQGICPNGWHLPTEAEINVLRTHTADAHSSDSLWVNNFGYNSTGFNALPAGVYKAAANRFEGLRSEAMFMGDTQSSAFHFEYYCCKITNNINLLNNAASIRCVKDCE